MKYLAVSKRHRRIDEEDLEDAEQEIQTIIPKFQFPSDYVEFMSLYGEGIVCSYVTMLSPEAIADELEDHQSRWVECYDEWKDGSRVLSCNKLSKESIPIATTRFGDELVYCTTRRHYYVLPTGSTNIYAAGNDIWKSIDWCIRSQTLFSSPLEMFQDADSFYFHTVRDRAIPPPVYRAHLTEEESGGEDMPSIWELPQAVREKLVEVREALLSLKIHERYYEEGWIFEDRKVKRAESSAPVPENSKSSTKKKRKTNATAAATTAAPLQWVETDRVDDIWDEVNDGRQTLIMAFLVGQMDACIEVHLVYWERWQLLVCINCGDEYHHQCRQPQCFQQLVSALSEKFGFESYSPNQEELLKALHARARTGVLSEESDDDEDADGSGSDSDGEDDELMLTQLQNRKLIGIFEDSSSEKLEAYSAYAAAGSNGIVSIDDLECGFSGVCVMKYVNTGNTVDDYTLDYFRVKKILLRMGIHESALVDSSLPLSTQQALYEEYAMLDEKQWDVAHHVYTLKLYPEDSLVELHSNGPQLLVLCHYNGEIRKSCKVVEQVTKALEVIGFKELTEEEYEEFGRSSLIAENADDELEY